MIYTILIWKILNNDYYSCVINRAKIVQIHISEITYI